MDYIQAAVPSIVSGITLAVVAGLARFVCAQLRGFREEHDVLLESQRNQLKASIVGVYERAQVRGHIMAMELDVLNRMADSYFALGGNHYIHAVVKQANAMEIRGELPG